jgi:hypothetical protein
LSALVINHANFTSPDALIGTNETLVDTILRCIEINRL